MDTFERLANDDETKNLQQGYADHFAKTALTKDTKPDNFANSTITKATNYDRFAKADLTKNATRDNSAQADNFAQADNSANTALVDETKSNPLPIYLTRSCANLVALIDESLAYLTRLDDFVWGKTNRTTLSFVRDKKDTHAILITNKANLTRKENTKVITLPLKQTMDAALALQNKILMHCYALFDMWKSAESRIVLDGELMFSSILLALVV